ncbi:hypothetical protein ABEB36_000335 [Hypothenemus hampei]|uniref:Uncharacterized protein n=1 Tax=Hypothenemus hampei TaxID=57062 RepID=A0ABD1FAW1_HYPHA
MSEERVNVGEDIELEIYERNEKARRKSRMTRTDKKSKRNPCLGFIRAVWAKFTETNDRFQDLDSLELFYLNLLNAYVTGQTPI